MYCSNCGKQIDDRAVVCVGCGVPVGSAKAVCVSCGTALPAGAVVCMSCGVPVAQKAKMSGCSKIAAGLLGIFLGALGVHNFYLGFTGKAIAQLLISILSLGMLSPVSAIWGLIEGILILTGSMDKDAQGRTLQP